MKKINIDSIEIQYEIYELSNIKSSKVCYDDIESFCKFFNYESIASVEAINDFNGGEIWQYERILRQIELDNPKSLVIVPLHALMHYECEIFIQTLCVSIDHDTFLPFPYNKYRRYIYDLNGNIDTNLRPMAINYRIAKEIVKAENRYEFIQDKIKPHSEKDLFKYKELNAEELNDYVKFLKEYLHKA